MAWTDQCKIQACKQVDHKAQTAGISAKKAIRILAVESGIPSKTLEDWYYKGDQPEKPGRIQNPKSNEAHWKSILNRLEKLAYDIEQISKLPEETPHETIVHAGHVVDQISLSLQAIGQQQPT